MFLSMRGVLGNLLRSDDAQIAYFTKNLAVFCARSAKEQKFDTGYLMFSAYIFEE